MRVLVAPLDRPYLTPAKHCQARTVLFHALTTHIDNPYPTRACDQLRGELERISFWFFSNNAEEAGSTAWTG